MGNWQKINDNLMTIKNLLFTSRCLYTLEKLFHF